MKILFVLQKYKSIFLWIWSFILVFLLLPSFIFVISNIFFYFWKYEISQKINSSLSQIFPYNQNLLLKQADYFYKKQDYQTALLYYLWIDCKNDTSCFFVGHNLWNTYYKFWDIQESRDAKINFWQKSLQSYLDALEIFQNPQTQANYDFVRKKLEELLEEEEEPPQDEEEIPPEEESEEDEQQQEQDDNQEQNQENQQENENSQDSQQEWQQSSPDMSQNSQNEQSWDDVQVSQNPNFWLGWNEEEWFAPLTPEEREMIEQQLNRLQEEELQNRELNKPGNRGNVFDQFWIERFFNNRTNQDW